MVIRPESTERVILEKCYYGHHRICKSWELRAIYYKDPLLGKIPNGKYEKVYCECPCHAQRKQRCEGNGP